MNEEQKVQTQISEELIFEMEPTDVIISTERPRQRKDLVKIEKMVESIKKYGQLLPILIARDNTLIAGGRRLAACMLLGRKARVCYKDVLDPLTLRELELEENLQREELTPAEYALAVDEMVALKRKLHGTPVQGKEGGFTLEDAAEMLGKTKGSVIEELQIAAAIKQFPNLSECKSKSDIKKAVKGIENVQRQMQALTSYEDIIKKSDECILVNKAAEEYLAGIGTGTVDLFFTDPPYGIDIHDVAMTVGGETGGSITGTGTTYDDSEGYAKALLERLVTESYRVTKDTGHALIFCAPSHFWWLKERMELAGWLVAPRPIVWIKRTTGQNNQPERWFSSAYEFVLFGRKPNSSLVLQGRPDWIQCDPVLPSERVHQAEKPVELCKELISRVCLPGQYMIDPCMGSGALVEAGLQMKVLSLGCEKSIENYALAVSRMAKLRGVK